jgi:DNA-binding MarR family transcriptional regulator
VSAKHTPSDDTPVAGCSESVRELLVAVRSLVRADRQMRRDLGDRMHLGANDLAAVRYVLATTGAGAQVAPRDVARHLGISTASTTALVDRLVAAGRLERRPHPTDRRSKVLLLTPHAREEIGRELTAVDGRMRDAAAAVSEDVRPAVVAFLEELAAVMAGPTPGTMVCR